MTNSTNQTEAKIHKVFDATPILKGIHAPIETVGGILPWAISAGSILRVVTFLVQDEMLDVIIIFLVWHEYGILKKRRVAA